MNTQNLVAWLPFDESVTQDLCGNEWTAYGNPTIEDGKLNLDGASYLQLNGGITLGGQDFTICGWAKMDSSCQTWGGLFALDGNKLRIIRYAALSNAFERGYKSNLAKLTVSPDLTTRFHFELDYQHSSGKWFTFFNGVLINTYTNSLARTTYTNVFVGGNGDNASTGGNKWSGSIDEFQIYDGIALHTENFTPPTVNDYVPLKLELGATANARLTLDVERKLSNAVEATFDVERKFKWRYLNAGTADTLIIAGTTLTNLPITQSKTGTAFYQTTRAKSFDLPATDEVWLKFDVYCDGSNRWRAYNGNNNHSGLTVQTSGDLDFFCNGNLVYQVAHVAKRLALQTILIHMISGSSVGVVEAWADGEFIYRYEGDVNHGQDFADIYLQSDGAGTFFSNVIISNVEVKLGEGKHKIFLDTERRIKKPFEISFDVQREIILPVVVPFIGEHFNHLIPNFKIYRDKLRRIILPKDSIAYICAAGAGVVDIYSDTDNNAVTTGNDFDTPSNIYTQLDTCRTVYLKVSEKVTAVQVIKWFMKSLDETTLSGTTALDEAINSASGGLFSTTAALISSFLNDLDNSASYSDFLETYCDIILGNADTGAITGADAGGLIPKDKYSIVPEPVPIEDWVVPTRGSSKTIDGLTVHFPVVGSDGSTFSDAENHILAGLNSVWIEQSLILVKNSFGLDFNETGTSVKTISVGFENNDSSNVLAHVDWNYSSGKATSLTLTINMYYYNQIITSSEDGQSSGTSQYLDRTLAHEFTHAVMAANIDNFHSLPTYIKEGTAELVHGIDDDRRITIFSLLTSRRADLETTFANGTTSNSSDPYAAGYMLLRYLAKQGQNQINSSAPFALEINNLLISDGAIDFNYNALTDNTRQRLFLDVLRTLIKSTSFYLDVAIFDVVPVQVPLDVQRNILATINVLPVDTSEFFPDNPPTGDDAPTGVTPPPTVLPPLEELPLQGQSTNGIQSFEIRISEQQLTAQVFFTSTEPFDVEQCIFGQFLDYQFRVCVERVQQRGAVFSYDCCSYLDELLYTQISPPENADDDVPWEDPDSGGDDDDDEEPEYITAEEFLEELAEVMGYSAETNMNGYETSWLKEKDDDDKASGDNSKLLNNFINSTYADVVREIFGWSSRIPTKLINVFIQDDKLYAVQREYEEKEIDITNTKHTTPVTTRELVRTVWSSSPNNKTEVKPIVDIVINAPEDDDEVVTIRDTSSGMNWTAVTTYYYHSGNPARPDDAAENKLKGQLKQVKVNKTYSSGDIGSEDTVIDYDYDSDGTRTGTTTSIQYSGKNPPPNARTENVLHYTELPSGEKFLSQEATYTYEDGELVDSTVTMHSPSRLGQTHSIMVSVDGPIGEISGQNSGDDRVTPYQKSKSINLVTINKSSKQRTIEGWTTFDTSFPISDEDYLEELTEEIKQLNRAVKETVSLTIYNLPHLINLNDKIKFNDKTYFLVSNTARMTSRIKSEQNITMVYWQKRGD